VFAPNDPVAPAKALKKFSDDVKPLEIKAAYVDGEISTPSGRRARLVAAEGELQAKLLGLLAARCADSSAS
jgi:ribosomal protein L10